MMRSAFVVFFALCCFALPTPARAENWVSFGDPWIWHDLDSVQRSGSLVTWNLEHSEQSGVPPANASAPTRVGIDCATRQSYSTYTRGGLSSDDYIVPTTHPDYVYFCITTAPSAPAPAAALAPAASPLLTSWRIEDMANAVRRQGGTTDGVRLSFDRTTPQATYTNLPYLIAATSAGRRFRLNGNACVEDRSSCYGVHFAAEYQFASAERAQQFVAEINGVTYGIERANAVVRAEAYLIFDSGITADNLAANVGVFMRDVDSIGAAAEQAGASVIVR